MKDKLIIIGASGHGKVVADIATRIDQWKSISFLDDDETIRIVMGFDVIGQTADASNYKNEAAFFVAIGNNAKREKIQDKLVSDGFDIVSLIHPSTLIGADVEIGIGTAIMAGTVISCATKVGKGCIINTSSSVDHDCIIQDYVHISPGVNLAGTVKVGRGSWLGIGSVVSNNVSICSECRVGAGAVVIKDITEPGIYVGIPARRFDK